MNALRVIACVPIILGIGCNAKVPDAAQLAEDALSGLRVPVPSIAQAKSIEIVCLPRDEQDEIDPFTQYVADALAERIRQHEFHATGEEVLDDAQSAASPEVIVSRANDVTQNTSVADVAMHLKIKEDILDANFDNSRVEITERFNATIAIYGEETESPYTLTAGYNTKAKATGPQATEAVEVATWTDAGYSNDTDTRLKQFADKCAESILGSIVELSRSKE